MALREDYRNAAALNNLGVALVERGHFEDALETFRESAFLMRLTMPSNSSSDHGEPNNGPRASAIAVYLLSKASARLAKALSPIPCDVKFAPRRSPAANHHHKDVVEWLPEAPIRIECTNLSFSRIPSLDTAIMLQNFGYCFLLLGNSIADASGFLQAQSLSVVILDLVGQFLLETGSSIDERHEMFETFCLVSVMNLNCRMKILLNQGQTSEAAIIKEQVLAISQLWQDSIVDRMTFAAPVA